MAKHLGFFNLDSVPNLFRDRKLIRSPGLLKTFSNFNKARARLLRVGKRKTNEELAAETDIHASRKTDLEDLNPSANKPEQCICKKPKSQSRWRSRINDIGLKKRLALGRKNDAVVTSQPDIENAQEQSEMLNPQTETSTVETVKLIETIGEIDTQTKSQTPEGISNGHIELQSIVDFGTLVKHEQAVQFDFVKISREEFCDMKTDKNAERIIRMDHKTSPPDADVLSNEEWRDIPVPVMDEIRRGTKSKWSHTCSKACPCKFSQELINIYHEAKLLSEVANKIDQERSHCKFRMTNSEIDFFKGDNKMCNVIIGETQSRRAEMRELMDMWQEANEKLTIRKKETVAIAESVERTNKRMEELEHLLNDWLPGGRMEKVRKAQRAAEKRNRERIEMLEDETRIFCQKRIEEIIQKREVRQAEEKLREEKRKNQGQKDTLSLQNATSLLQKYIDERKSLLIQ